MGAHHDATLRALDLVEARSIGKLLFESLDHFLAEVAPLRQLLLHLLVDLDLALVGLNLLLHLVVLEDEDFCLFGLMLQLGCQLMVLEDGQVRRGLQLLVVHGEKVRLRLLDVEEHLLAKLLRLLDPIQLFLIDLFQPQTFLVLQTLLQIPHLLLHLVAHLQEGARVRFRRLHVLDLRVLLLPVDFVVLHELGDFLLVVSLHLLELDLKVFDILLQIDLPFRRLFMLFSFLLLQLAVQIGGFILLEGHIFDSGLLVGVALLEEQKALLDDRRLGRHLRVAHL